MSPAVVCPHLSYSHSTICNLCITLVYWIKLLIWNLIRREEFSLSIWGSNCHRDLSLHQQHSEISLHFSFILLISVVRERYISFLDVLFIDISILYVESSHVRWTRKYLIKEREIYPGIVVPNSNINIRKLWIKRCEMLKDHNV